MSTNERKVRRPIDEDLDPTEVTQAEVDAMTPDPNASLPTLPAGTTDPVILAMMAQLTKAVTALSEQSEAGPIKQIPITKMDPTTPFNKEGLRVRPQLTRKIYQNGQPLHPSRLTNQEIDLLNKLKPGEYHSKKWIVASTNLGEAGVRLDIFIPNKTMAQRLEAQAVAGQRGFEALLEMMVEEGNRVILAA